MCLLRIVERHVEIDLHAEGFSTIEADNDAMKALAAMSRNHASRLLVTDEGKLVGVLALKDLLKFLSLKLELENNHSHSMPASTTGQKPG